MTKPGAKVKLRFINAASSSNFWLNLGSLHGTAVAVDGHPIQATHGAKFELAIGQRMDFIVTIPTSGGTFPILAQVEGLKAQTGLVLTTNAKLKHLNLPTSTRQVVAALDYAQEQGLHAQVSLPKKQLIEC